MKMEAKISIYESGAQRGFGEVKIEDAFVITGIRVMEGSRGLFVALPSHKVKDKYEEIVFPITKEAREELNQVVLEEYQRVLTLKEIQQKSMEGRDGHEKEQQMDKPVRDMEKQKKAPTR